jgi:hypothetical protein
MPYWDEEVEGDVLMPETMTVIEDDDAVDTGLMDTQGNTIYRTSERVPAGFQVKRDG